MTDGPNSKKGIWENLIGIMLPFRKRILMVVLVGILGTVANLIEPLIYREAINDIAGLFVQRAKNDAQPDATVSETDTDINPIVSFFEEKFAGTEKEPHSRNYVASRTPGQAVQTLLWAVVLLFIINVVGRLFQLIAENMNAKLSSRIERGFIFNTFTHVLKLPLEFFTKRSSAALGRQINQSEEVSVVVSGFSQQILPEIISLCGILVIMFLQNLQLTLIALAIIPFYVWIAVRSAFQLEASLPAFYEKWENISSQMQDALAGIKTVKLSGAEHRESDRLHSTTRDAYGDYIRRIRLTSRYAFLQTTLTRISSSLVLGYGGYLALEHQLTPGDVVMFVAYLDRLYIPIDTLATLWINLQQNAVSISRAFKLLVQPVEERKGKDISIKHGKVEFKDVRFGYQKNREVLKGISFCVQPGKVTAIVGPSGAGKTTAVDLIMKLYAPSSGEILIDDHSIDSIDSSSVRRQIGMVAADGSLFRGTLGDNIRYKNPSASEEDTLTAATAAGMSSTLHRLPEGLKTKIGEGGIGLSFGERQRLQIARILIAHPRILILDEATANLDYATEKEIRSTIKDVSKENTVIVIAHRYSMVRDADHVVVLEDGKVLEEGSPAELRLAGGWFAEFAQTADKESLLS